MSSDDCIHIQQLAIRALIGIFEFERETKQEVLVSLRLYGDVHRAARSDVIADALDYKSVSKRVITFVSESRFQLLEALAEGVAALVLREFKVRKVQVRIDKPGALRHARSVAVEITREKP